MTQKEELIKYAKTSLETTKDIIDKLKLDNIKIEDIKIDPYFCYSAYSFIINYTAVRNEEKMSKQVRSNLTTKKEQFYRIDSLMYEFIEAVIHLDNFYNY